MTFLYLNSDKIGSGDEALGKILMESFLEKLIKSGIQINAIGCVNSGINLTTSGSHVIDILKNFKKKGAGIASCGTCLDFYDKRDKLAIGKIGTMEQTVQLMLSADKVIQP